MTKEPTFAFMDEPSQGPVGDSDPTWPGWLGLVTNHRRLFEASQDGWLRPLASSGFLLGRESFASEECSAGGNAIPVRLAFDVNELPFLEAKEDLEAGAAENGDGNEFRAVRWRAPLPLYAVKAAEVASTEQKTRILAMAGRFSNVSLPDAEIAVRDFAVPSPAAGSRATSETQALELPDALNAAQGAMTMAVWAVPHVEPWIEVLRHALNRNAFEVAEGTAKLDAQWLQFPWLVFEPSSSVAGDADDQKGLWQAALRCMRWSSVEDISPKALAERIAQAACLDGENPVAETWLERTRPLVAADKTIDCDDWRKNGAGFAIWLALLRPDPTRFKSWNKDLPGVPPGLWWAAANLCGWQCGYRALDKEFRGDARLQEFIATRALEFSWPSGREVVLPPSQRSLLERTHQDGCYSLTWRGEPVLRKDWKARAKWYAADLTDVATGNAARDLAGRMGWPCIERRLLLPEGRVRADGGGRWFVDGDDLVVEGEKCLRLSSAIDVAERVDPDEFRRRLATEVGIVPDPPETYRQPMATVAGVIMDPPEAFRHPSTAEDGVVTDPTEADGHEPASEPPGLMYRSDFITEDEEAELLACIDGAEWSTELRRRVQHYGWRYDYKKRRVDESMRLGELPEWAQELGRRLVNEGLMKDLPDQLIVNEYCGKQCISPHIDAPGSFTGHIATISLLETWDMRFRLPGTERRVDRPLERRSVAVLTGDARYEWTHEIPERANEPRRNRPGKGRWIKRSRRISLTFRKTRLDR